LGDIGEHLAAVEFDEQVVIGAGVGQPFFVRTWQLLKEGGAAGGPNNSVGFPMQVVGCSNVRDTRSEATWRRQVASERMIRRAGWAGTGWHMPR
jgi:hypothetical protein